MLTSTAPLLCLCGLLGVLGHSAYIPGTTSRNGTAIYLKPNERFRRLIPYMTFYFTQQSYDNRPHFQQYNPAPIYIRNNKEPVNIPVPQYQGNLVAPAGYLLRFNPITAKVLSPLPPAYQIAPQQIHRTTQSALRVSPQLHPFTANEATNYNTLQNNDAPQNNPLMQIYNSPLINTYTNPDFIPQTIKPPVLSTEARTNALIQIINLLQQAQRLPQTATTYNNVQTLSQVLNILQQTKQLPAHTKSNFANVLKHLSPTSNTLGRTNNEGRVQDNKNIKVLPGQSLDAVHNAEKSPGPIVYNNVYTSELPSITTSIPEPKKIVNLQSFNTVTKLQPSSLPYNPNLSSGYVAIPIATTHIPITNHANDLQNDYTIKVLPNNMPTTKTMGHFTTPSPELADDIDSFGPYNYAKQRQSLYQGPSFSQSFPDPHSEGSTPGKAGIDYPVYDTIPTTSFTCKSQRYKGFFGDPETSCQVWHYCDLNGGQASFLCPNGTIFSQVALTCDWWFNVRCESTHQLYVLNERLYKYILPVMPSFPEDYSGPVVDKYLTLKFQEQENKKDNKTTTDTTSKRRR